MQNDDAEYSVRARRSARASLGGAIDWLERVDPGAHRRIKGLRLVTAYGIAAMLGAMADIARGLPKGAALSSVAGGFALWASVSEGRGARAEFDPRPFAAVGGRSARRRELRRPRPPCCNALAMRARS